MSFKTWTQYKLDEVYDFASGLSKSRKEFGFGEPFVTFKDVFYNYFLPDELNELANTTEKERERCSVKRGDVFLTRTSETSNELGKSSVALKDYPNATFNGFTKRLRPKYEKVIAPEFSGYYFRCRIFRNQIDSMVTMTTRASLNNDTMSRLTIIVPPLEEQKAIAKILSDLDEKIEINNKINKNLEEMAQAIFKRWFVDFEFPNEEGKPYKTSGGEMVESELGLIPKGWKTSQIGNVVKIIRGASPRPIQAFINKSGIPWLKISDATSSTSKYIYETKEFIIEEGICKSRKVEKGTLILSNSATPGIAKIMEIEACVHDGWLIFSEYKEINKEYIYYNLCREREKILAMSNGSVFRNLKTDILKGYPIIIPNKNVLIAATTIFKGISNKINKNGIENKKLEKIRNALLPKLMSGEVRVPLK